MSDSKPRPLQALPPEASARYRALIEKRDALTDEQQKIADELIGTEHDIGELAKTSLAEAKAAARALSPDPPLRADGKCFLCGATRPDIALAHCDPFCSTDCCKTWHDHTARRLALFPKPGTLMQGDDTPFVLTPAELRWIVETAIPRMRAKKTRNEP